MLAVASSMIKTLGSLIKALAMQISYLCPRLKLDPPSSTTKFRIRYSRLSSCLIALDASAGFGRLA